MDWEILGQFLVNNGIAVVVVLYFLRKDATLTEQNTAILHEVKAMLELLMNKDKER